MVEYSTVNVRLSDSQLNKLKSAAKNQTGITFSKIFMETIHLMNYY